MDSPSNLKLKHGQHAVSVEYADHDGLASRTFELDNEGKQAFTDFIAQVEPPLTIHSQEATLEQIFIKLTGGRGG